MKDLARKTNENKTNKELPIDAYIRCVFFITRKVMGSSFLILRGVV